MKILDFAFTIGKLKILKRTGWVRKKIPNPESVAEHSFRTAVLALVLAPRVGADANKAVKMALIHDIGEAEIGDIVTVQGVKQQYDLKEKSILERKAFMNILSLVDGKEYLALFDEFEQNKTKEAQLVRQIDKLEMVIQAYEYEKKHEITLQEWFDSSTPVIIDQSLKEILETIETLRKKP